jgi:hypothetical protein
MKDLQAPHAPIRVGSCADRATGNRGNRGALSGGEGYVIHSNGCSCRMRPLRILVRLPALPWIRFDPKRGCAYYCDIDRP